jgi:hypothetical protein
MTILWIVSILPFTLRGQTIVMCYCVRDDECLCSLEKSISFSFTCQSIMTFLYNFWCKNRKEKSIDCNVIIHIIKWKYHTGLLGYKSGILHHVCKMIFLKKISTINYTCIIHLFCFMKYKKKKKLVFFIDFLDHNFWCCSSIMVTWHHWGFFYAWLHLSRTGYTKIK